jgi:hypothetical protein
MGAKKNPAIKAEQESAQPPKKQAMDKGDVSKMLSYLKYHSRESNKCLEDQQDAATALAKYKTMKTADKNKFLQLYEANKGSLKWVHAFETTSMEIESTKAPNIKQSNTPSHVCLHGI